MTPAESDRKPPLVPSHIAWPAFIVFLLTISIVMVAVSVVAARSDGGTRPVETPVSADR